MLASLYKPLSRTVSKKTYNKNIKRNIGSYKIKTPIADEILASSGVTTHRVKLESTLSEIHQELTNRKEEMSKCSPELAQESFKQLEGFVTSIHKIINQNSQFADAPKLESQYEIFGLDALYEKYFKAISQLQVETQRSLPRGYEEAVNKEALDSVVHEENMRVLMAEAQDNIKQAEALKTNIATLSVTDILGEFTEIDKALDREVLEARWDLAFGENA